MLDHRRRTREARLGPPPAAPDGFRLVDTAPLKGHEPPDPWEEPCSESALGDYTARRLGAFPSHPRSLDELPPGARAQLEAAVGPLEAGDAIVLPRTPRPTGPDRRHWVVTPTSVLAVGDRGVALWVAAAWGPGIAAAIPLERIAAVVDRTILLYGRLEVVGDAGSLVVRYNTVGRQEVGGLAAEIRRSFWPAGPAPAGPPGRAVDSLPHKWRGLLRSGDANPCGPGPLVVAAGPLDGRPGARNGIAALSDTELLVATEPALDAASPGYGVDLVAVPRRNLASLAGDGRAIMVAVSMPGPGVRLRIPAHPSLAASVERTLGPHLPAA